MSEPQRIVSPFDSVDVARAESLQQRRAHYESEAVRYVLQQLGLAAESRLLQARQRELTGHDQLTFELFHREQTFPVRLGVASLFHLTDVDLPELFKRFTKTLLYRRFQALKAECPGDERPLAMFFNWPRLSKFTVLHTAFHDMSLPQAVFLRPVGKTPRTVYALEPAESFLAGVSGVTLDYQDN